MTPLDLIAEWRNGCSCAPSGRPEECHECTVALIDAIERQIKNEHKEIPAKIANSAISKLREKGLDCVSKGSYQDASPSIHDAVFFATQEALSSKATPSGTTEPRPEFP